MNDRLRKILIVAALALITIGLGYLIYRLFFAPAAPVTVPVNVVTPGGVLPVAKPGAPTTTVPGAAGELPLAPGVPGAPVVTTPTGVPPRTVLLTTGFAQAISATAQKDGVRTFNPQDGKFYKILPDGTQTAMSDQVFYNVSNVTWGNQSDKAVLEYPDSSKILYDFTSNKQYTLPKYWEDFNFSPQDDKLVTKSIGNNETNRFLVVSNPDGTNAQPIADLGNNQDLVHVSWSPNNQVVAYSLTGDAMGFDEQQIILVGQHQENYKGLVVEGRGFIPNWSPSGNNLLYSVHSSDSDFKPELWISGASGDQINANRRKLGIQTWADKCAWQSESVLICAVPASLDSGAGLQRDLFNNVPDNIFKIDLSTGQRVNLGQPDGAPAIQQMTLSGDGKYLLYTDRATGRLTRFSLAP